MEEFLEGYQIFWPRFIGVSNILEKIVKCLMGCKIFGKHFRLQQEICILSQQKVLSVSSMFTGQEKSCLK